MSFPNADRVIYAKNPLDRVICLSFTGSNETQGVIPAKPGIQNQQ